jgi:aminodeoxyfutalosine synthase
VSHAVLISIDKEISNNACWIQNIMSDLTIIAGKLNRCERLSRDDALLLLRCTDILPLGAMAADAKRKRTADKIFFNINRHVNLTNVCLSRCTFCAFSCDKEAPQAYVMTEQEVLDRVRAALPLGITEVHMVSGLHPDKPFAWYRDMVAALKREFPAMHIKAFTPVEIQYFADISGLSVSAVLEQLIDAGLGSLPGGGAEVLSPRVRQALCPKKASAAQWLAVMRTAHRLGLRSNATLLWGHIETDGEIADHLLSLRDLQDETGGFQTFIPLPFHSANTELTGRSRPTAFEQLRLFAAARLLLDNFDHIKAYWIMTGLKIAQMALLFGADDVDGTVVEERITHAAGAETAQGLTKTELMDIIRQAGMRPVQRDTLYNEMQTD